MPPQTETNTEQPKTPSAQDTWRDDFPGSEPWLEALTAALEHADSADERFPTESLTSYYSRW